MARKIRGVKLSGLQPEMLEACDVAEAVYAYFDKDCIVTSGRDPHHSDYSHHYKGLAIDLRTRHLSATETIHIHEQLQMRLGDEYQVILETDHIHVEYDPRKMP